MHISVSKIANFTYSKPIENGKKVPLLSNPYSLFLQNRKTMLWLVEFVYRNGK